jgi:hypothetical protein
MKTIYGLIAATALTGFVVTASPAEAKKRDREYVSASGPMSTKGDGEKLGRGADYFVVCFPGGLPHVTGSRPCTWTPTEFDQLQYLDGVCRAQMRGMRPSALKSITTTFARNVPGAALGGFLGAKGAAFKGVKAISYGKYNGIATGGGSLGGGITAHAYGKHYSIAGCMDAFVSEAKRDTPGVLKGIRIVYNAFPTRGHRVRKPDGPGTPHRDYTREDSQSGRDSNEDHDDTNAQPR